MTKTYVNINGEIRDTSNLEFPKSKKEYRAAWKLNGKVIEVDMFVARKILKDRLRELRKPEFDHLDTEYMKALEKNKTVKSIIKKKEFLRNLTDDPKIEACTNPEELTDLYNRIKKIIEERDYGDT